MYFDCFLNLSQLTYMKIANDVKFIKIEHESIQKEQFLPKLESIFFSEDTPDIIGQFNLTNIQTISLNDCEIDMEIARQLSFDKIKKLYLRNVSQIETLSLNDYLGDFGESLLEIDLSFNSIVFEKPNQFISESSNLEKLRLAGMKINNFSSALDLSVYSKLVLLDLSYNSLEFIEERNLKFSFELKYLYLSNNCIQRVENYSFFNNEKLIVLDLSYNQIEVLTDDMFASVYYYLKQLHLNNNRLKVFTAEYKLQSLFESIRLDNNFLTEFPSTIYFAVTFVDELNLSENLIETLKPEFFSVTNRIVNLFLQNCSISLIENDSFKKMHMLILLDLSYNNLEFLNDTFFDELGSLRILDISSNKFVYIQTRLFKALNRLTHLNMSNNQIQFIEDTSFVNLHSLMIIKLNMNPIVDLFTNYTFTGFFQLKLMLFSSNVSFNLQIIQSIINQTHQRMVREVLNIKFYDSIEISSSPELELEYSPEMCFYISYFIRNQISFNLQSVDGDGYFADKYIDDCQDWSTDYYQTTLVN
jgi:Leucine-rich repeat (LRR) protein